MAEYIAWWLTTMGDSAVEGVVGKTYDLKAVAAESLLQPWVLILQKEGKKAIPWEMRVCAL
jgi:hypothetical protein